VNRHVYTCVVGESIVQRQESEQTSVYMCGRGINFTFFLTIFRLDFGTVTTTKKNYVKRNKIVSILLMTSLDKQEFFSQLFVSRPKTPAHVGKVCLNQCEKLN
jgi:uncharacterized protein YmfQ (DUF2313 family)